MNDWYLFLTKLFTITKISETSFSFDFYFNTFNKRYFFYKFLSKWITYSKRNNLYYWKELFNENL